jgi:hypothetical protein
MKNYFQTSTFVLLISLLIAGCVGNTSPSNRRAKSSSNVSTGGNTNNPIDPVLTDALYWFSAEKVTGTITLNLNNENVIYLRGQSVHTFLNSKDPSGQEYYRKQFCIVGEYGNLPLYHQLRVRAVPIYISNLTTKSIERILRVDVPSKTENTATCGITTIDTFIPGNAGYAFNEICPSCATSGKLTSSKLQIFERNSSGTSLSIVPSNQFALTGMNIRVDLTSNSTTPGSSCTNSACEAKGFDCCIEGQCVKDASLKTNASLDPLYAQSQADYALNPLSFINYPNIFNVCANINHNPPSTGSGGTTPVSEAEQRVKNYFNNFSCINKQESNLGTSTCTYNDYLNAKKTLAVACGCPSSYTDAEREIKCPNWGVRSLYKNQTVQDPTDITNISDFMCYTPLPENPMGPISNLNVSVPSRTAPHRFYSTAGTNYDDIAKLASTIIQEGTDFTYLDNFTKTGPVNGAYNANSILGRMKVDLSQTSPAKMVAVELGKTYILSAINGYFTPCSKCAKDSWFQSFSAHPATSGASGLKAIGYTTSRDTYSANTTFGNYEDTKFGRACYVPLTMLAYSHKKESSLQTQRLNRLQTQSALYVNGYQRDWYGFNKGALIGSFDGVKWFAIGNARRITASSTKLYLAINGAFLDLADRTDTIVNIIPDTGGNTAADFDYDPDKAPNSITQNSAGSCQQYHMCSTDSDCVTKLGWEYTCTDVSQMKVKWPIYDTDAKEIANQEQAGTLFEILNGTTNMGASPKRCVYRGAGAPCVRDIESLDGNFNQKALTCAPNFYCAALNSNRFNEELVRSPNEMGNILFGMDANVLGRPLNYVTATKTLTTETIANIKNVADSFGLNLSASQISDMGVCRPGRMLDFNLNTSHQFGDSQKRTDYISQVGSCNSQATGNARFYTCPVFGDDLNYVDPTPSNLANLTRQEAQQTQNACGGEAKLSGVSAFKVIEGLSLGNLQNITTPTLVQDACYRRAGSVCHTDLDCGPNKMHEEIAGSMALSYFGGTEAEQSYWKESLVCGQGTATPSTTSADYLKYNLSQNRCCREIGKDFTMYTSGPAAIIPENTGSNASLDTSLFAVTNPNSSNRYSRYTISPTATLLKSTSANPVPKISATAEPKADQWKVINETGSLTCCGGGWIRKFADGTHDWKIKNRMTIDSSNFSCLNFRSPLVDPNYNGFGNAADDIVLISYQREFENFCRNHIFAKGCFQVPWPETTDYQLIPPIPYHPEDLASDPFMTPVSPGAGYTRMDTSPTQDPIETSQLLQNSNPDAPYPAEAYYFTGTPIADLESDTKKSYNFFTNKTLDYSVSMYLPAYIPFDTTINAADVSANGSQLKVYIKYFFDKNPYPLTVGPIKMFNDQTKCKDIYDHTGANTGLPVDRMDYFPAGELENERYCIALNAKTQNRPVINVKAYTGADPSKQWKYAGIVIEFETLEHKKGTRIAEPGSSYYYLTKLGRLELNGIPQITYEPLYCNNDQSKLVPGIFKSNIVTRADFATVSNAYTSFDPTTAYEDLINLDNIANYGNSAKRFTYRDQVALDPIFSSKDFACCTPLGKETTSGAKCCSGSARTVGTKQICQLPAGTDLNVYFNKFVSSEGVGVDQPGGEGLVIKDDDETKVDFMAFTGEPKLRESTLDKLKLLGEAYCEQKIVTYGGAFGYFPPEPFSGSYNTPSTGMTGSLESTFPLSIVDSIVDFEKDDQTVGKFPFDNGYRWNHHIYCK